MAEYKIFKGANPDIRNNLVLKINNRVVLFFLDHLHHTRNSLVLENWSYE